MSQLLRSYVKYMDECRYVDMYGWYAGAWCHLLTEPSLRLWKPGKVRNFDLCLLVFSNNLLWKFVCHIVPNCQQEIELRSMSWVVVVLVMT